LELLSCSHRQHASGHRHLPLVERPVIGTTTQRHVRAFYCLIADRNEATAQTASSATTAPKAAHAAYAHHGVGTT